MSVTGTIPAPVLTGRRLRIALVLATLGAIAFSTILYKYTLRAWFQEDDFAWLGLSQQIYNWGDFWHALFAPMAQGTIRPISERAFYMGFYALFGLNALPYRILVYATHLGNIAMLGLIAFRLTKSVAAAFWAPVLWAANSALAWPLTWTATYNEVLCSFVFLLSFYGLVRYTETGEWRFNALQWASYLIGFCVLEINVVYPAVALVYVALFAPRMISRVVPLLAPAVLFTIVHALVGGGPARGIYALHWDGSLLATLLTYWERVLAAQAGVLTVLLSTAVLGFTALRTHQGDRLPVFGLSWFLIVLAPFLPLRDHISDYYLTVPSIGLALLGASAIVTGWRAPIAFRALTVAAVAAYLAVSVPAARKAQRTIWARSASVKKLVLGVEAAHDRNPGKTIVLEGVGDELFWNGVYDHPFRLLGIQEIYLTPDAVQKIHPYPELANVADYTITKDKLAEGLAHNQILVCGLETGVLLDITPMFKATALENRMPKRIEVAHPPMDSLLGPSWYQSEGSFRWMPKDATVRIGAPERGRGELRIEALCNPLQLARGPMRIWADFEGWRSPTFEIVHCKDTIRLSSPVEVRDDRKELLLGLHVEQTIRVGADQRDLGLAVRSVEIADLP